jgi:hypothetical protein
MCRDKAKKWFFKQSLPLGGKLPLSLQVGWVAQQFDLFSDKTLPSLQGFY